MTTQEGPDEIDEGVGDGLETGLATIVLLDHAAVPKADAGAVAPSETGAASKSGTLPGSAPVAKYPVEIDGRTGPDPTRYGDWELRGRCIDF